MRFSPMGFRPCLVACQVCQGLGACVVEGHLWPCAQAHVALFAVEGEALDPPLVPSGVNAQGQAVAVPVLSWFGDLLHPPGGEGVSLDARHGFPPRNISTRSVLWGQENVKNVLKMKWTIIVHFALLAERVGFEPTMGCPIPHFRVRRIRPLCHLSAVSTLF